jgi:cytochrome c5
MSRKGAVCSALLSLILVAPILASAADETSIRLADGTGREQVQASCSMCHSLDYILMNSPFQDRAGWEKTVNKMVKVMGAPLTADDITAVVGYLESHYGKESPSTAGP